METQIIQSATILDEMLSNELFVEEYLTECITA